MRSGLAEDGEIILFHSVLYFSGAAIGLYFRDPEGNRVETFWLTGLPSWAMISVPINIDRPDDEIMADVRHVWEVCKQVEMGVTPEGELKEAIRKLSEGQPVASAATS